MAFSCLAAVTFNSRLAAALFSCTPPLEPTPSPWSPPRSAPRSLATLPRVSKPILTHALPKPKPKPCTGYDQLVNIVLDQTTEFLRDPDDPYRLTEETRSLGLTVCRGPAVMLISPTEGMEEIANPFLQPED